MFKRVLSITLLALVLVMAVIGSVQAAHEYCFEINGEEICIPLAYDMVKYYFDPDPGPYSAVDISEISEHLTQVLGREESVWLIVDMEGETAFLLDMEHQAAVDLQSARR